MLDHESLAGCAVRRAATRHSCVDCTDAVLSRRSRQAQPASSCSARSNTLLLNNRGYARQTPLRQHGSPRALHGSSRHAIGNRR